MMTLLNSLTRTLDVTDTVPVILAFSVSPRVYHTPYLFTSTPHHCVFSVASLANLLSISTQFIQTTSCLMTDLIKKTSTGKNTRSRLG